MKKVILILVVVFNMHYPSQAQVPLDEENMQGIAVKDSNIDIESYTPVKLNESEAAQKPYLQYGLWSIGILIAGGIGFIIGRRMKAKNQILDAIEPKNTNNHDVVGISSEARKVFEQMKADLDAAHHLNKSNQDNFNKIHQFDTLYFEAASKKIIDKFWEAVNQKDEKQMIEYAIKAVGHYTSVSNYKRGKSQGFDLHNLFFLTGQNDNKASDSKVLDRNTFQDEIPNQIRFLIQFLKKYDSKGLDETSFLGYTIKEI